MFILEFLDFFEIFCNFLNWEMMCLVLECSHFWNLGKFLELGGDVFSLGMFGVFFGFFWRFWNWEMACLVLDVLQL